MLIFSLEIYDCCMLMLTQLALVWLLTKWSLLFSRCVKQMPSICFSILPTFCVILSTSIVELLFFKWNGIYSSHGQSVLFPNVISWPGSLFWAIFIQSYNRFCFVLSHPIAINILPSSPPPWLFLACSSVSLLSHSRSPFPLICATANYSPFCH